MCYAHLPPGRANNIQGGRVGCPILTASHACSAASFYAVVVGLKEDWPPQPHRQAIVHPRAITGPFEFKDLTGNQPAPQPDVFNSDISRSCGQDFSPLLPVSGLLLHSTCMTLRP